MIAANTWLSGRTAWCLLLSLAACAVFAQSNIQPPTTSATTPLTRQDMATLKDRDPNETYPVMTTNGNTVAHLMNVIADPQSNEPRFAVLHLFDNVSEHHPFTVVPWDLLKINRPSGDIVIQTSIDKLRKAPSFQQQDVPKQMQGDWPQQVYAFYGVKSPAGVGSGMLPSGTLKGSGANTTQPSNPARGSRTFLWTAAGASVLLVLLMVINRRRVGDRQ